MSSTVISVENVSKKYRIGSYDSRTLRDDAQRWWAGVRGLPDPTTKISETSHNAHVDETLWALNNVSFDIKEGEALGIIGRNGAGKSTLLKILSRITLPTEGKIKIKGRISSLLEVGTGFHPELTGRENIFLNGSILGMKRAEISRKIDEIVDFSGVEKFIDMPVKRYSSGMYIRLAFSVAANLDSDILILDEVLSVGDIDFQRKSFEKMSEVIKSGRTLLFVSHALSSIGAFCDRTILLNKGVIELETETNEVVTKYALDNEPVIALSESREWTDTDTSPGSEEVKLCSVRVCDESGVALPVVSIRQPIKIEIEFDVIEGGHNIVPGFYINTLDGICAFTSYSQDPKFKDPLPVGRYKSVAWIPRDFLAEGFFKLTVSAACFEPFKVYFSETEVIIFEVVDTWDGTSVRGEYKWTWPGVVRPMLKWETEFQPLG